MVHYPLKTYILFSSSFLSLINYDQHWLQRSLNFVSFKSKESDKDQEVIQLSATPDPGYHMGKPLYRRLLNEYVDKQ